MQSKCNVPRSATVNLVMGKVILLLLNSHNKVKEDIVSVAGKSTYPLTEKAKKNSML